MWPEEPDVLRLKTWGFFSLIGWFVSWFSILIIYIFGAWWISMFMFDTLAIVVFTGYQLIKYYFILI